MEQAADLPETTSIVCDNCRAENPSTQKFCSSCSYPISGSLEERQQFVATIGKHKLLIKRAKEQISNAKIIIYLIAGFTFLAGLFGYFKYEDFTLLIVNIFMCLLYLIMAAWADKNPFAAILTAFIIYITVILINAVVSPGSLFSGIIWKVIFIAAFIKAIRSAQAAQESMNELEKYKIETRGLQ
jgi:di/tricarboxylate transporter